MFTIYRELYKVVRAPYLLAGTPHPLHVTLLKEHLSPGELLNVSATFDHSNLSQADDEDAFKPITAAEVWIDTPPWLDDPPAEPHALVAQDGDFDAPFEVAQGQIPTDGLSEGRHILYVRGRNRSGQWGVVSAAFFTIQAPAPKTHERIP